MPPTPDNSPDARLALAATQENPTGAKTSPAALSRAGAEPVPVLAEAIRLLNPTARGTAPGLKTAHTASESAATLDKLALRTAGATAGPVLAADSEGGSALPQRSALQMKAETAPSVLSAWASGQRAMPAARQGELRAAAHETQSSPFTALAQPLNQSIALPTGDRGPLQGHIASSVHSPEFQASLASSVRGLLHQGGQAQFSLNPVEMGPITIKLDLQGDQARVSFAADVAATRDLLEKSQPWLSQALGEAGLRLVQTHITAPTHASDARGQAFQQQPGQQSPSGQNQAGTDSGGSLLGQPGGGQHAPNGQHPGQAQSGWNPSRQAVADTLPISPEPLPDSAPASSAGQGLHTIV